MTPEKGILFDADTLSSLKGRVPEACVSTESDYLHKLRVFESEDDIAIFISIAILELHMPAVIVRFCVTCNIHSSTIYSLQLTCL